MRVDESACGVIYTQDGSCTQVCTLGVLYRGRCIHVCVDIYIGIKVFISSIYVYMQVHIHTVTGRAATGQGSTVALLA